MPRCYVRNGVPGWPIEAQEAKLREADEFDLKQLYRDELSAARAKKPAHIQPEWLEDRKRLLQPAGRRAHEIIAVATWPALAVSESDVIAVLRAAEARRATILAVDSGLRIEPGAGLAGADKALEDWRRSRSEAKSRPGRAAGNRTAAERRRERTLAKLPKAKPLWRSTKPNRLTVEQVVAEVGLSAPTLFRELGRRPDIKRVKPK